MPKDGRSDILTTYHFYVEVQGDNWGSFRECSGLINEQEVITHTQAGKGGKISIHKVPGPPKSGEMTLKRAKKTLGAEAKKDRSGSWSWALPQEERRLTEEEARRVQKLIAQGMSPKLARAEVLKEGT